MDELRKEIRRLLWDSFVSARMETLRKQEEPSFDDLLYDLYSSVSNPKRFVETLKKLIQWAKTDDEKSRVRFFAVDVIDHALKNGKVEKSTIEEIKELLLRDTELQNDPIVRGILLDLSDMFFFHTLGEKLRELRERAETDPEAKEQLDRAVDMLMDWAKRIASRTKRR